MGEAKRRRRLQQREWKKLFGDDNPVAVAISRPEYRPETARQYVPGFMSTITKQAMTNEPALCGNTECSYEFRSLPEVYAVVKTSQDAKIPPICVGICPACANKNDEEIFAILRRMMGAQGLDQAPKGANKVTIEFPVGFSYEGHPLPDGMQIIVEAEDETMCPVARYFVSLLEAKKLPRFVAFWRGKGNCHAIVDQLHEDFKALGIAERFKYKMGSAGLFQNDSDPVGLHSWIEADGWVIDASAGGFDCPIRIQRIESYYESLRLKDVRDRTEKEIAAAAR